MTLGIGLGAFAGGFQKGYGLGKEVKSDFAERKFQNEIKSSYEDSQKKFQEGLAAGTYNENQFMDVFKSESVPRIRDHLLKNGRVEDAMRWEQWGTSDKGMDYTKLYGKGRVQFGVGDYGGFTNSLNQMAKSAGLDYNFSHVAGDDSNPARIRISSADGKTVFGDYGMDEVPQLYDQWFNPTSGFHYQTQQTNRNTAKAPGITGGWGSEADDKPTMNFDVAFKQARELASPDASLDEIKDMAYKIQEASRPSSYQRSTTGITGQPMLIDKNTDQPVAPATGHGGNTGSNGAAAPQQKQPLPKSEMDYLLQTLEIDENGNKIRQQHGEGIESAPLPEPQPEQTRGRTGGYAGMPFNERQAPGIVQKQGVNGDKSVPIPANKPPSREQLFQKWQERKPSNNKEHAAYQDEKKILQMMGERASPEKVAKAVAAKFPYSKRELMSPEFKELVESYIQGFGLDPKMGWQVKEPVGLGAPLPKANPNRKNATIPDL